MNGQGIIIAVVSFLCIGLFHPLVIWAEYIWSAGAGLRFWSPDLDFWPPACCRRAFCSPPS